MQVLRKASLCLFVLVLIASCSVKLTPQQQTLWAVNVYNAQYDLYLDQVIDPAIVEEDRKMLMESPELITDDMIRPDLSEDQREILREKKKVLVELHPLIITVKELQATGGQLDAEMQNHLTGLINRLIAIVGD